MKTSDIIIEKYLPVFRPHRGVRHIILTSGRAGTKSSFAAIRSIAQITRDPGGSVVALRKRHNKLRKTIYKEMLRGITRLQFPKAAYTITKSPMEITYNEHGTTIYFAGSDGIDDTKGIIDENKPIKLVVLDELTEFFDAGEGEDELQNIEATFVRGNDADFQMLYLYNPPQNPNSAINRWCEKMERRPDCVHIHTDYRDVPVEWLGQSLIESAEMMKRMDEKRYRWVWLGQAIGVDELIYYMFSDKHKERPASKSYKLITVGVDYGQQNATTYEAFGLNMARRTLDGLAEYYHSGRDTGKQKSPSEYAGDFKKMIGELHVKFACSIFYAYIDPSAKGLAEEIKRAVKGQAYRCVIKDAENAVALGISRVQKALTFDLLRVSPEQENLIREFGTYEYDKKSIERGKESPVKEDDHCMDALRYAVMGMWNKIKHYIPTEER